jgi:hypothetical protein
MTSNEVMMNSYLLYFSWGLPDGLFSYQKAKFGYIFEGLGMEKAIWYIMYVSVWYIFNRFGILYQEKSGNPVLVG